VETLRPRSRELYRHAFADPLALADGPGGEGVCEKREAWLGGSASPTGGEVGETDAALEMVAALGLADPAGIGQLRALADRVAAMTWGLIRRERKL